jgi:S1-C subfamily serine protease
MNGTTSLFRRVSVAAMLVCAVTLLGSSALVSAAAPAGAATRQSGTQAPATSVPAATQSTPEGKAAAIAEPAIAYLEMHWNAYVYMTSPDYDFGVEQVSFATRCTGFFVNPNGYVATAGHCVDDGVNGAKDEAIRQAAVQVINDAGLDPSYADQLYQEGKYYWRVEGTNAGSPPDRQVNVQHGIAVSGKNTGEVWQARVIDVRDVANGDVALLKVETTDMPMVSLAQDVNIDIGAPVLSIGYPGATDEVTDATYEPSFKDGKVDQKTTLSGGAIPVYQTSAALSGGMSGGPTVDDSGDVVGVNSFTISGESQPFNYVMPSSLVQELLSRNGVDNTLTDTDRAYRDGVNAYYIGDYRSAVTSLDKVLEQVPSHQQAQELRKQAAEKAKTQPVAAPAASKSGGSSSALLYGAVAVVVLVVAGGLAFGLRRRRAAEPVPPVPTASVPGELHPETLTVQPNTPPLAPRAAEAIPDTVQFCRQCGVPVEAVSEFCSHCGTPLRHATHGTDTIS